MIDDGALENPHVDRTFALHLYSGLDVGKIGVRDGAFFASADEFDLTIRGKGGHGAMPQLAVDPVAAGAYLVTMLQTIVSREVAPKDPAVVTVGQFVQRHDVQRDPGRGEDEGHRARVRRRGARDDARAACAASSQGSAKRCASSTTFDYHWSYPPTVNARAINDIVREVGRRELGAENVVEHDIVMWAEDMSFMQEQRPGRLLRRRLARRHASGVPAPQRAVRHRRAGAGDRLPDDGRAGPARASRALVSSAIFSSQNVRTFLSRRAYRRM